jgi:branched-chain amino acid transport system permease protein
MQQILVYSFAGAALGGFDSPIGAVVGGLIVGVAEVAHLPVRARHRPRRHRAGGALALILVVLLIKPNGLFGRTIVERV